MQNVFIERPIEKVTDAVLTLQIVMESTISILLLISEIISKLNMEEIMALHLPKKNDWSCIKNENIY